MEEQQDFKPASISERLLSDLSAMLLVFKLFSWAGFPAAIVQLWDGKALSSFSVFDGRDAHWC